jgi:hypothetical protein
MRAWSPRQWLVAAGAGVLAAAVLGLATGSIPNPVTFRQIPVPWWGYVLWVLAALLSGLLAATYVSPVPVRGGERRATVGGILSVIALGCPVCNKLVLLALGTTGALSYFAPVQPVLALVSIGLLGEALRRRLLRAGSCAAGPARGAAAEDER